MAKYSWKYDDQYWQPEAPSPDQRVPSIPPPPLLAVSLLPRRIMPPTRFDWGVPIVLAVVAILLYALGCWRMS